MPGQTFRFLPRWDQEGGSDSRRSKVGDTAVVVIAVMMMIVAEWLSEE
jgi:hypothetical protein